MLGCQVLRGGKPCHASTSPKWVITGTARSAKIEHQCPAMRCVLGRVSQLAAAAQETLRLCGAGCHWRKMGHPPSGEGECWGGGERSPRRARPQALLRGALLPSPLAAERRLWHPLPGKPQFSPQGEMEPP